MIVGLMITSQRPELAFLSIFYLSACGHAGSHPASPATSASSAEVATAEVGVGGAPLPDGRYAIRLGSQFDDVATFEVANGIASLTRPKTVALKFVGPGPLWHLVAGEPHERAFEAELLVLDEGRSWILSDKQKQGAGMAKMRDVPARLQGEWTRVSGISKMSEEVEALKISPGSLSISPTGEAKKTFSAAWLQSRADTLPGLVFSKEELTDTYLTLVAQDGLLALSVPGKGLALFVDRRASGAKALTIEQLQKQSIIYFAGREAYNLKCQTDGCDLAELGATSRTIRLKKSLDQPTSGLRLRQDLYDAKDVVLVPMNNRVLALGNKVNAVALSPLAASAIPPSLLGSWKASVVFPVNGFDLTEVHVGKAGVETKREQDKPSPAYLVQSAYDDGILLLASRPGSRQWELWRLTQAREGWYLSRWRDGVGPVALWQGAEPSWLAGIAVRAQKGTARPSDRGQASSGEGEEKAENVRAWTQLDGDTQTAAVGALNKMWAGALTYYETDRVDREGLRLLPRFPGKNTFNFTPDCCKAKGACPADSIWKGEPWQSLNFWMREGSEGLRFDFISEGESKKARFLAIVAIDPDCSGKPVYVWRRGHIDENGDVTGGYQPEAGEKLPKLSTPGKGK
jgi:hypothetical protein